MCKESEISNENIEFVSLVFKKDKPFKQNAVNMVYRVNKESFLRTAGEEKYIYEVIKNSYSAECKKIKFIIDYDSYSKTKIFGKEKETQKIELINEIIKQTKKVIDINLDINDVKISENSRWVNDMYKLSYHFVVPKIVCCSHFLSSFLKNNFPKNRGWDNNAYSGKLMRWILSMKPDQKEIDKDSFGIINGEIEDFILQDCEDCDYYLECPNINKNKIAIDNDISREDFTKKQHKILDILEGIKKERMDDYNDWINLGMILKNELGESGFYIWNNYSQLSHKYNEEECKNKWHTFGNNISHKLTIRSLYYWLKIDNIDLFEKLNENKLDEIIQDNSHMVVGMYIMDNYENIYSDLKYDGNDLYEYDHKLKRWINSSVVPEIICIIIEDIKKSLDTYAKEIECVSDKKKYFNAVRNVSRQIGMYPYMKNLVEFLKNKIYHKNFADKLDANPNIIGFNNVVLVLDEKCKVREINQSDYLTKTTGYDFPDLSNTEVAEEEINNLFLSMFETEEMKEYYLDILAFSLNGERSCEEFFCLKGDGRNGKGTTFELLTKVLGEYISTVSIEYFTKPKTNSSSADPEIDGKKGVRIIYSMEPDGKDTFQKNKLKLLTGGDYLDTRENFSKKTKNWKPQFTIFLQTNEEIKFSGKIEKAIKERMNVIEFPYSFVQMPEKCYEKKKDPFLKTKKIKSTEWRDAMLKMLIKRYEKLHNSVIIKPHQVEKSNKKTCLENNLFLQFIDEYVIQEENTKKKLKITCEKNDFILVDSIYEHFKKWCILNEQSCLSKNSLTKLLACESVNKERKKINGVRDFYFTGLKKIEIL